MAISDYPEKLTSGYYRVREMWEDASSQVGAYKILSNAIKICDENPGTFVFDTEGNAIYPENAVVEESGEEETGEEESGEETGDEDTSEESGEEETETPKGEATTDGAPTEPTTEETGEEEGGEEFPEAIEYENDGNETPIAYTKLSTLMNVRVGNNLHADIVTTYRKNTIIEVLQICSNGWLRFACAESPTGYAYVSNVEDSYNYGVGVNLYTVKPRENIKTVAKNALGDESRYMELREMNGLDCNVLYVGMKLVLSESTDAAVK